MEAYCSMFHIFSTYNTPDEVVFLVFGVSNVKNLAFDTPDESALKWHHASFSGLTSFSLSLFFFLIYYFGFL